MIEAIIFDFDGVLFDSQTFHFASTNMVLEELGLLLELDLYNTKYTGTTDHHVFQAFLSDQGHQPTTEQIAILIEKKIIAYRMIIEEQVNLNAVDGALHFLQHVSKKLNKLAVCSNANRRDFDLVFSKLERGALAKFFQFTITYNDVSKGKPSPEGYLQAAKRLGVDPKNCLVIEDSKTGIMAGKSAGMNVVGLTTNYSSQELQEVSPNFIANSYEEIEKWLAL